MSAGAREELLVREQRVELPLEDTFEIYGDALNLERITPPWLRFRVTTPAPIEMRVGTLIEYRLRLHGIPVRWKTRSLGNRRENFHSGARALPLGDSGRAEMRGSRRLTPHMCAPPVHRPDKAVRVRDDGQTPPTRRFTCTGGLRGCEDA